jgi:O-antigen/teichoic acid export membrane protein
VNALWASLSTTLTNTLNAIGKIKTSLQLMILWTALTWGLTPFLIGVFGYNGVALASALTATSSVIVVFVVKRILPISVLPNITAPLISTAIMGSTVYALSPMVNGSLIRTGVLVLTAVILYAALLLLFAKNKVFQEIGLIIKYLRRKT